MPPAVVFVDHFNAGFDGRLVGAAGGVAEGAGLGGAAVAGVATDAVALRRPVWMVLANPAGVVAVQAWHQLSQISLSQNIVRHARLRLIPPQLQSH